MFGATYCIHLQVWKYPKWAVKRSAVYMCHSCRHSLCPLYLLQLICAVTICLQLRHKNEIERCDHIDYWLLHRHRVCRCRDESHNSGCAAMRVLTCPPEFLAPLLFTDIAFLLQSDTRTGASLWERSWFESWPQYWLSKQFLDRIVPQVDHDRFLVNLFQYY